MDVFCRYLLEFGLIQQLTFCYFLHSLLFPHFKCTLIALLICERYYPAVRFIDLITFYSYFYFVICYFFNVSLYSMFTFSHYTLYLSACFSYHVSWAYQEIFGKFDVVCRTVSVARFEILCLHPFRVNVILGYNF